MEKMEVLSALSIRNNLKEKEGFKNDLFNLKGQIANK